MKGRKKEEGKKWREKGGERKKEGEKKMPQWGIEPRRFRVVAIGQALAIEP